MSLSQGIVRRPVLTVVAFSLVIIIGLYSMTGIAIDLFPDINPPYIMVTTTYKGSGPETVEKTVTRVLENQLSNVQGVKKMTSTSSEGSSLITLEFDWGTNLDAAGNDVRDKIDRAKSRLPDNADLPTTMRMDPSSMPIIRLALRSNRSPEDLREMAENVIQPRLEQVSGVASASVSGGRTRVVRVDISQNRLAAYGLTIQQIASALAEQNSEIGGGKIAEGTIQYVARTTGEFRDIKGDIANSVVATRGGYGIRLSDVAAVTDGYEDEETSVTINGEPGVYVSVARQSGTNSVATANAVYKRLEQIRKALPADVSLEIIDDTTTTIRATINDLISSVLEGAGLAMAFVFLFLRTIKSTVIIGLSIPISIVVTLLAMYFAGLTLNMMTLAGLILGVGMMVDSSIVILENMYQYRQRGAKVRVAAILGSQEMLAAISASNITTICVFLPILLFGTQLGMMGVIFKDMIFTVVISLVASWIVAILLVPVLASHYLPLHTRAEKPLRNRVLRGADEAVGRGIEGLEKGYRWVLTRAVRHPAITVCFVALAFASSLLLATRLNIIFAPTMSEDSLTLNVDLPLGTTLEQTKAVMTQLESKARGEIHGIKNIISTAGGSSGFFGSSNVSSYKGQLTITLPARAERIDGSEAIKNKLRAHFDEFPNATFGFSTGRGRVQQTSDIDIAISSTNYSAASRLATDVLALIRAEVPQVLEPESDFNEGLPQVEISIDRQRLYSFGVSVATVSREIEANIGGTTPTVLRQGGNEYDVLLMLQAEDRSRTPDLEKIFVVGSSGKRVPVSSFATIKKGTGPVDVKRENQARTIHVKGNLAPGEQADRIESEIRRLMAERLTVGSDVTVEFSGAWSEVVSTGLQFAIILAMAILLVFGVMAAQYESFRDPLINLFTIPLMFIGVFGVYALKGQALNMFTAVGLVLLAGVVVNNGIILVDYTNLLRGRGLSLVEACIQGGAARLRPVLMTAVTTILGVVPMAFFPGESSEMIQPIGLTVAGGLTSSTFITLFFIPVVYYIFNRRSAKKAEGAA